MTLTNRENISRIIKTKKSNWGQRNGEQARATTPKY